MSTKSGGAVAERVRQRTGRAARTNDGRPTTEPPRQRRPALAALALLLIVGGALLAGLLAVRMDSREPVLVAARDIAPGTKITAKDLAEAKVASDVLKTIPVKLASQVVGTYATTSIPARSLVEEQSLSAEAPVSGDRAVVAVSLNPALTPASELRAGDLVQVVRVNGSAATTSQPRPLTTALVLSITQAKSDSLGGSQSANANLLVPAGAAGAVIDASAANLAGLALLERGQDTDVELEMNR